MQNFPLLPTNSSLFFPIHFPTKSKSKHPLTRKQKHCFIQSRRRRKAPPPPAAGETITCRAMASNQHCLYLALLFLFIAFTYSDSPFLSYGALRAGKSTGRSLLQAKKSCPIDMEGQNYTILTTKCKGPKYPPELCCEALLEFCCGFVEELNDMTNNCAETMFSYINLYGQYPPGLFANQCKEGEQGLSCDKALKAQAEKGQIKLSSTAPPQLCSLTLAFALTPALLFNILF